MAGSSLFNLILDEDHLTMLIEKAVMRVLDKRLPPPPEKFFTFRELSTMLNCSRVTLHNLRAAGHLECVRPKGTKRCLVSQKQLDNFLLKNPGWAEDGEIHGENQPVRRRRKTRLKLSKSK